MVWLNGADFGIMLSMEWIDLPEKYGFNLKDKTENGTEARKLNNHVSFTYLLITK
jgi:hypothetical protein